MADRQGLLGVRSREGDGDAFSGRDDREAYEEDWYRSLRALAERQQQLTEGEHVAEEPAAEQESDTAGADLQASETAADQPTHRGGDASGSGSEQELASLESLIRDVAADAEAEPELDAVGDEPAEAHLTEDGVARAPMLDHPAPPINEPMLDEPEHDESVVEEPGPPVEEPVLEEPADEAPEHDEPVFEEPEPSVEEPVIEEPVIEEPVIEEPVLEEPVIEEPVPSLGSTDPKDRRLALEDLASRDLSDADTHRVEALLLDPEADIRRLALHTLARRADRVQDDAIWQALQDPTDEVRAAAVELAAKRGDVGAIAPLLAARDWPLTQRAVLQLLPEMLSATPVDDQGLRRILSGIGDLDPAPGAEEQTALGRLELAVGARRIIEALSWPDVPRLGAIRLLARERSSIVLRELASHRGDPIEEIAQIALGATEELAAAEEERERARSAAQPPPEEGSDRITSLSRALQDEDATVRHLALAGLGGMDRAAIAAWVDDAVGSGDPAQLSLAASTAQMLRLVESAAVILDAAAELPVDARQTLMGALQSFLMPPEQLAGLLSQVREEVRAEAIRLLWHVGGPPLLPHLRPFLDDPATAVRQSLLDVFAESGDPSAADVARITLETDVSPNVRTRAVRMLSRASGALSAATIVRAMSDPDAEVRATAIETLPDVDGAETLDALISSLSDQDDRVRLAAAKRLASRAADPELVWSALRRAPDSGRGEIIASFERVRNGSLTQIALERLRSPEQEERILAVEVCGWGSSPGCVEGAIQALLDPGAPVRRAATVSLGRLRDPAAAKALGKALGDPDPQVRIGVVQALGVIDDEAVLGFLVSALNDPDARVRDVTSQVLTEWSSPAVAKRLAGVLAVPRLREAATDLLTRIGPPAVELLVDVLMQHNPAVAPTVGALLLRIAQPDDFLSRLDAVEPERRLRGVEALGAMGGPAAVDALLRSVSDPDERIRARAAQLLPELGDPRSRDALTGLLRDPIPGVVAAAQEALARST